MGIAYPECMKIIVLNPGEWKSCPIKEYSVPRVASNDAIAQRIANVYKSHPRASVYLDCGFGAKFIEKTKSYRNQVLRIRSGAFEKINGCG